MNPFILRSSIIVIRNRSICSNILKSYFDINARYWFNGCSSMLIKNSSRRFSMSTIHYDKPISGKDFQHQMLKFYLFDAFEYFIGLPDDLPIDNLLQRKDQWKKYKNMEHAEGKTIFPFYTSLTSCVYFQILINIDAE